MITGAKAMVEGLKEQGVDIIFGYPGATICPFYAELRNDDGKSIQADFSQTGSRTRDIWSSGHARQLRPGRRMPSSRPVRGRPISSRESPRRSWTASLWSRLRDRFPLLFWEETFSRKWISRGPARRSSNTVIW